MPIRHARIDVAGKIQAEERRLDRGQRQGAVGCRVGWAVEEVNRGAVVISPTPESIEALYTARERLESAAVSRIRTPEQLTAIDKAFGALAEAAESRNPRRIVEQDLAFHATIVRHLDSSRLDEFYAELTQELRFYLMVLSVEDREFENPGVVLAEHEAILSAIHSGDPERAVREVRTHIETNAQRLTEIIAERE